jgi:hypothetical protein
MVVIKMDMEKYVLTDKDSFKIAIERAEAKVPAIWGDGYADGYPVFDTWECPNCAEVYELDGQKYNYCPKCGQHIDWTDWDNYEEEQEEEE